MWPFPNFHLLIFKNSIFCWSALFISVLLFNSCLLIYMLNYLLFLSMVHEYAYFVMNIFGKRSINVLKISETNLGIVMHFVLESWVVSAFSSSSKPPIFFSFFTKLFTAFSGHILSDLPSLFFRSRRRLITGADGWKTDDITDILSRSIVTKYARSAIMKIKWGQTATEKIFIPLLTSKHSPTAD